MARRFHPEVLCLALPLLLVLPGCGAPRSPLADTSTTVEALQPLYDSAALAECIRAPAAEQRTCRDRLVRAAMVAIDLRYTEFEIGFFETNRALGFGSAFALLGLGAAGSLAGNGTAQVLSAISGLITGSREAFGREALGDQTAPALRASMQAARNEVALRIHDGLRNDISDYPMNVAMSDLAAYFRAGTLGGGVSGLTRLATERAQITEEERRRAIPVASDVAARCLQQLISERTTRLRADRDQNRRRIRSAMDALNIPAAVQPHDFVFDMTTGRAEQHRRVAELLNCRS